MSPWIPIGTTPPARAADPAATAGSSRIFYRHRETGAYAYRHASGGTHGTGVHGFRDYGDAVGCDEWGRDDGRRYPAADFSADPT